MTGYKRYKENNDYNASSAVSNSKQMPRFTVKAPVITPASGSYTGSENNGDSGQESGGDKAGWDVIRAEEEKAEEVQPEETDGNSAAVPESPKTMQEKKNVLWLIVAGIIALAGIVFAAVFVWKRKEENSHRLFSVGWF